MARARRRPAAPSLPLVESPRPDTLPPRPLAPGQLAPFRWEDRVPLPPPHKPDPNWKWPHPLDPRPAKENDR